MPFPGTPFSLISMGSTWRLSKPCLVVVVVVVEFFGHLNEQIYISIGHNITVRY